MIIECPSCKTRFSVDADHVVRIENPRFHCSRCDHYFFQQAKSEEPANQVIIEPDEQCFDDDINQETAFAADEVIHESNFSKESLINEDRPQFFASWPDQKTNEKHEMTVTNPGSANMSTDFSTVQSEFIRSNLFPKVTRETPTTLTNHSSITIQASSKIESTQGISINQEERNKIISNLNKKNLLQRTAKVNFAAIYSCLIFLSFPLLAFIGIFSWSQNLAHTPPLIKNLLGIESNNFPYPPPLGLDVIDLQSKFVNLDNGIKALEIRGLLHNATSKVYEDVMLDSRLFNQENKLLDRIIVSSSNKITTAKIEALSAEAILDMQKSAANRELKVAPNDKIPFRVMFFPYLLKGKEGEKIKWFSTRVYSTRATVS